MHAIRTLPWVVALMIVLAPAATAVVAEDAGGTVEWSEVTRSSGDAEMDEVALALFNQVASFRPGRNQGVRVSMSVIFSVAFPW